MEQTRFLIIGAGVTGLAFADRLESDEVLVCEASNEIGGYCRTIERDGFVWDYSGHFFHFKHPEIEAHLRQRMGAQRIREVVKDARIAIADRLVDFPFQKNIHQLPREAFIDCLVDLYFREDGLAPANFREMLYAKFGRGIAERFLIPYNEKLYATDLAALDVDAMGRFFPHADVADIIRNFRRPDNASYNATFTYPEGGAIEFVRALEVGVPDGAVALGERVESVDLRRKTARTNRREIRFDVLVSSAPFPQLLEMVGLPHDPAVFAWNKVLVFNLGFDRKGPQRVNWIYFPERDVSFYRVGFYDNIFDTDRMSLYVELGYPAGAELGPAAVDEALATVLGDLARVGLVGEHALVARHAVVLDPAYVHVTRASQAAVTDLKALLACRGVHAIGRYGSWTYCSIEDNIVEAQALADRYNTLDRL